MYFADQSNTKLINDIKKQLEKWSQNHERLETFISISEKIKEIENISRTLAEVSDIAYKKLNGAQVELPADQLAEKLLFLETGEHGVIVAVVPGLRRILFEN
jgi:hypothetical protein